MLLTKEKRFPSVWHGERWRSGAMSIDEAFFNNNPELVKQYRRAANKVGALLQRTHEIEVLFWREVLRNEATTIYGLRAALSRLRVLCRLLNLDHAEDKSVYQSRRARAERLNEFKREVAMLHEIPLRDGAYYVEQLRRLNTGFLAVIGNLQEGFSYTELGISNRELRAILLQLSVGSALGVIKSDADAYDAAATLLGVSRRRRTQAVRDNLPSYKAMLEREMATLRELLAKVKFEGVRTEYGVYWRYQCGDHLFGTSRIKLGKLFEVAKRIAKRDQALARAVLELEAEAWQYWPDSMHINERR